MSCLPDPHASTIATSDQHAHRGSPSDLTRPLADMSIVVTVETSQVETEAPYVGQQPFPVKRVVTRTPKPFGLFGWSEGGKPMFCTFIQCDAITEHARPIALLTKEPLGIMPPVELHYDQARSLPSANSMETPTILSRVECEAAWRYTFKILAFLAMQQEWLSDRLPYLILPATNVGQIDWTEVFACIRRPELVSLTGCGLLTGAHDGGLGALQDRILYQGERFWLERPICPLALHSNGDKLLVSRWPRQKEESPKKPNPNRKSSSMADDSLLLEVSSLSKAGTLLRARESGVQIRHGFIKPSTCFVGSMSASMLRSARILPSVLTSYEQVLLARQCNADILAGVITDERRLQEALSTPFARQSFNYQTLEFFGDCILKFVASCVVFVQGNDLDEGKLTSKRAECICNAHLTKIAERFGIAEYAFAQDSIPKRWHAHGLASKAFLVSDKMQADFVEALLGAAWLGNGFATVIDCINRLHVFSQHVSWQGIQQSFAEVWISSPDEIAWPHLDALQHELNYRFQHPQLARQAVTHAGVKGAARPSYERLEFLGDAVLDVCVVDLLRRLHPALDQEGYSKLKAGAVANASLSVACLATNLPGLLHHSSTQMAQRIDAFRTEVDALRAMANVLAGELLSWQSLDAPKQLADVVESTLGAVFVDAGFDLEAARVVFIHLFESHFVTYFHPDVRPAQNIALTM